MFVLKINKQAFDPVINLKLYLYSRIHSFTTLFQFDCIYSFAFHCIFFLLFLYKSHFSAVGTELNFTLRAE